MSEVLLGVFAWLDAPFDPTETALFVLAGLAVLLGVKR